MKQERGREVRREGGREGERERGREGERKIGREGEREHHVRSLYKLTYHVVLSLLNLSTPFCRERNTT